MRWSYIITLSMPARDLRELPATATYAGSIGFRPGTTRTEAYMDIYGKYAAAMQGGARGEDMPNTLFFSLEPDTLEA